MFGHEKVMMNGNGGNGGGGSSSAGSTIAAVVATQTQAQAQAQAMSTAAVTTSASTSAVTAATTPVGASNSSALAGITSNGMNGANQNANNHRASDTNKRRKSKNRNSTVPNSSTYSKEHLDAWLETCLKDASSTQLSSSSEFLDYNPTNNFQSGKKAQQQQQRQQPNPYQLQQQHFSQPYQQQFGNNPRQPIYPAPFSQGFQKSVPTFLKNSLNNRFSLNANTLLQHTDGSVEFASLPPIVNLLGSENENNSTDVLDGSSNPNISRGFRFSDPCLLNPSDNDSKVSGQETPDRRNFKNPAEMENNKFFAALMEQINLLHETNSKICRNLHETKVDIEALKHAPNWGLRHRRDSISGLSTHSQPLGFGFGTQSPAPTYHSGAYTPGMMTDVVREVKEAARVREDALLSRVKAMVEERSWSMGENSLRLMRDIEELRSQIQSLRADRKETNKRIAHLETENKYMRQMLASIINNRNTDIIYENEALRPTPQRKIFPTTDVRQPKRANSLNLHYGVIHQADEEEEEEPMSGLHIAEQGPGGVTPMESSDLRNSFSSSDGQISIVNSTSKNGWPDEVSSKRVQKPPITEEASELRKELQEAIAARKQADNRIIALENMVKKLQVKLPNGGDERMTVVVGGNNQMMMGGSKNGGGSGAAAAPAYSFHTSSLSSSSSPAPKVKSEHSTINALPTALISSASSGSQIFHKNSSNQMHLAQQLQLQKQQQQHLQHQQQLQLQQQQQQQQQLQQQQQQQSHLPAKLSLAGPITDL